MSVIKAKGGHRNYLSQGSYTFVICIFFLIGSIYDSDNDCGKKIADSYTESIYVLDIKCKTD